jgi:hypothetical protein
MNPKIQEFVSQDNYPIKKAEDMNVEEVSKWMALCNALKFINHTSQLTGVVVEEKDIDYREVLHYIDSVGGDIETCLKKLKGIPFKYSLSLELEDSIDFAEINYEYII